MRALNQSNHFILLYSQWVLHTILPILISPKQNQIDVPWKFYTSTEITLLMHKCSSVCYNWKHWTKLKLHAIVYFCTTNVGESEINDYKLLHYCWDPWTYQLSLYYCTISFFSIYTIVYYYWNGAIFVYHSTFLVHLSALN